MPQPAYGQPVDMPASKALGGWALGLALIPCGLTNLISVVLAVMALVKSRDGRNHGKGLAIAALIVNVVVVIGLVLVVTVAGVLLPSPIDDLKKGECFTASGLDTSDDPVDDIEVVSCTEEHDAEVLRRSSGVEPLDQRRDLLLSPRSRTP